MRPTTIRMRGGATAVVMLLPTMAIAVPLVAQAQIADTTAVSAPYRAPQLALASPIAGEGLPQDKPSIVLRYARGELDDPLDLTSLAVLVDGENRSAQFHADSAEAWGSIDPLSSGALAGQALALGVHQFTARICSTRGVCTDLRETVMVVASPLETSNAVPKNKKTGLLAAALAFLVALIERFFTL